MGRKAISDLLTSCKPAAYSVEGEMRDRALVAGRQVAIHYRELLQYVLHAVLHTGSDVKPQLTQCSRDIAQSVTELVAVGQLMKGMFHFFITSYYFAKPNDFHTQYIIWLLQKCT